MLTIRPEQWALLVRLDLAPFIAETEARMLGLWPEHCEALGRAETRRRVEAAMHRALDLGLESRYDLGRFAQLVFALEDPEFADRPWAAAILQDAGLSPRFRMNRLWTAAREVLAAGEGAEAAE
jgi:hypothetical protein